MVDSSTTFTIGLLPSGVSPGTYPLATVAFDTYGRATSATAANVYATISVSGDAVGTVSLTALNGLYSLPLTLASVGTPGTYNSVVVDANGRVVYGTNIAPSSQGGSQGIITLSGDASGSGTNAIPLTLATVVTPGTYSQVFVNAKGLAVAGANPPISMVLSGDVSGSGSAVVGGTALVTASLIATGTPGTYNTVVTDANGRVTSGSLVPVSVPPQVITASGDVSGTGTTSLPLTLAFVASPGTYSQVVVNAKGLSVSGANPTTTVTISGDVSGTGSTVIGGTATLAATLASTGTPGTYNQIVTDAKGRVTYGTMVSAGVASGVQTITVTGDVTGSGSTSIALTLASVATPGTYQKAVVDAKGRIVGGGLLASGDIVTALGYSPASTVSPSFSGTPTAPTVSLGDNSNALATTAFVKAQNYGYGSSSGTGVSGVITLNGDVTGTGTTAIAASLIAVGTPGTYNTVVTDTNGRVTAGSSVAFLKANQPIAITGDASGSGATAISLVLAATGVAAGTYATVSVDPKGRVLAGTNPVTTLSFTGDATASAGFAVGGSLAVPVLLASVGTAGTYNSISTDAKGRVVAGSLVAYLTANQVITATGDATGVTSGQTLPLTLASVGTPGTYQKTVVDAKGRVVAGAALTASDITGAIGYAPAGLASPTFTGAPLAPTAAQFDATTKLATTAFVKFSGLTLKATTTVSASATLAATLLGGAVLISGNTAPITLTLPLAASAPAGSTITISNTMASLSNVVAQGTDTLSSTVNLQTFEKVVLYTDGASLWRSLLHSNYAGGNQSVLNNLVVGGSATISGPVTVIGSLSVATSIASPAAVIGSLSVSGSTVSVPTVAVADNSTSAASTAFVKAQNYLQNSTFIGVAGVSSSGPISTANVVLSGNIVASQWQNQGAILGWNYSGTSGETDLMNSQGGGSGGFNFYNTQSTASAVPVLLAAISGIGSLSAAGINSTPIGGSTPAAGYFTTLQTNGVSVLTANQPVTISGDANGTGSTSIPLTLATTGVIAGSYTLTNIVVDSKGRILSATSGTAAVASGTAAPQTITVTGDATGTGMSSIVLTLASVGSVGTYSKVVIDTKGRVTSGGVIASSDVTTALGYTPVSSVSPTITGTLTAAILAGSIASFTATLTAPTATVNTNTTQVATTAYVHAAGLSFATTSTSYAASTTLTATAAGQDIITTGSAALTLTLPAVSTMLIGAAIGIANTSTAVTTVVANTSDTIEETIILAPRDHVLLVTTVANKWRVASRNTMHNGTLTVPTLVATTQATAPTVATSDNSTNVATTAWVRSVASVKTPTALTGLASIVIPLPSNVTNVTAYGLQLTTNNTNVIAQFSFDGGATYTAQNDAAVYTVATWQANTGTFYPSALNAAGAVLCFAPTGDPNGITLDFKVMAGSTAFGTNSAGARIIGTGTAICAFDANGQLAQGAANAGFCTGQYYAEVVGGTSFSGKVATHLMLLPNNGTFSQGMLLVS